MDIKEERDGEIFVLSPDGDLSSGEDCHALERRLAAVLATGARYVVVDCARVGHLTSPALRALLLASRKLARVEGRLVLCGMTSKVQKAFAISGFDRDFSVSVQREDAGRLVLEPLPRAGRARTPGGRRGAAASPQLPAATPDAPAAVEAPTPETAAQPLAPAEPQVSSGLAAAPPAPASPVPAPAPAPAAPLPPDPRLVAADRLLAALVADGSSDTSPAVPLPPDRAASLGALADTLLRAVSAPAG
jgi:anti-anti-sigma factor